MSSVVHCVNDYVFESNFGPVRETKTCRIPRNTFITNSVKNVLYCGNSIKETANSVIHLT